MGTPAFSVPILEKIVSDGYEVVLVVTQPDRPKGRKKTLTPPPVKEAAIKLDIPVYQPEKVKDTYQEVLDYDPDLIVTAAFGQILPKPLLDYPRFGCVNVHASLLPEYRGGAPIHQAIIDGKKEIGVTLMYMVEALDAGDMIAKRAIPIEEDDTVGTLFNKLSHVGRDLLSDTLPDLFSDNVKAEKQEDHLATYAPNITREREYIDWTKSSEAIYNQVRGMNPFPVASTKLDELNIKLFAVKKKDHPITAKPGTILAIEEEGVWVQTIDGAIILEDFQLSGKKRLKMSELLNGNHPFKIGETLGEKHE